MYKYMYLGMCVLMYVRCMFTSVSMCTCLCLYMHAIKYFLFWVKPISQALLF